MVALVLGMLLCLALAVTVVALVAVPARREGREVLTPRGDEFVGSLRDRTDGVRQRLDRGEAPPAAGGTEERPEEPAPTTAATGRGVTQD
ncbi:MAG TPA: hypothetical protein VES95_10740 [Dermatophilaceae bacterium]|nr:hypothetical protein [Dermatophilaceae bacterium]